MAAAKEVKAEKGVRGAAEVGSLKYGVGGWGTQADRL